jgi:hypothetical protein
MQNNKAIGVAAGLATLGASAMVWFSTREFPPRFNPKPHEAAGKALAQQSLDWVKPGGQIIVIARDTTTFKQPAAEILLASFTKTIRSAGAANLVVRSMQVDPLRPVVAPAGDFADLIRKAPEGSVIVSLMGPPLLTEEQRSQLGEIKPKIIAFCPGTMIDGAGLRQLFEQRLLNAAVVSKRSPVASASPNSPEAWFEEYFVTVTASNLGDLSLLDTRQ